jgi:serine/threonine protein kinase
MIGTRIGSYVLQRILGEGAMGVVYYAEHVTLKKPKAIKVLLPQWTTDQTIVKRFLNEARAAAAIRHRNIVDVDDFGQLPDGSSWYIIMDWREASSLTRYLAAHGRPLAPHVLVHIAVEVAYGLQAAHDLGITHRDIKPDNILIGETPDDRCFCQIVDFGVAKLGGHLAEGPATRTGTAIGTPAYMAPEALVGGPITTSVDVWALGAIVYQLATKWLPYQDESAEEFYNLTAAAIYHRQMTRGVIDPRQRNPKISDALAEVLLATLDREPARRPASARAFAIALAEAVPSDGFQPAGIDILRTYAGGLLHVGTLHETVRGPQRTPVAPATSRYQLGEKLGEGGMAEVFAATVVGAEGFARPIAIKRVLTGFSERAEFATMFIEEARIASRLQHPNVVSVLDFDRDPESRLFLAMEFVAGKDLAALVETGPLPPAIVIFLGCEILHGVGHAHEKQVLHRDISPHNVLLSWEGAVKVSDFGIAKALSESGGALSASVKGKAAYMSPEQANGERLDARSDLFAVGVVLWELVVGRRLFAGDTRETFAALMFRDAPAPSTAHPCPSDLERAILRLLAREPANRYACAEDAIADLSRCVDNPRDGRGELVRLLASRFPNAPHAKATPAAVEQAKVTPAAVEEPTANERPASAAVAPSTFSSVASQSVPLPPAPRSKSRRWIVAVIGSALVGASIAVVLAVRGESTLTRFDGGVATPLTTVTRETVHSIGMDDATLVPIDAPPNDVAAVPLDSALPPIDAAVPLDAAMVAAPIDAGTPPDAPHRTPTQVPHGTGELAVSVGTWATVTIDGKSYGQTPVRQTLPAGRHRVRLQNDVSNHDETVVVTVNPNETTPIRRNW